MYRFHGEKSNKILDNATLTVEEFPDWYHTNVTRTAMQCKQRIDNAKREQTIQRDAIQIRMWGYPECSTCQQVSTASWPHTEHGKNALKRFHTGTLRSARCHHLGHFSLLNQRFNCSSEWQWTAALCWSTLPVQSIVWVSPQMMIARRLNECRITLQETFEMEKTAWQ